MIKAFIKEEAGHLALHATSWLIFCLAFFLFGLPKGPLLVSLALACILTLLYYGYRFLDFKEQRKLQDALDALQANLAQAQEESRSHRLDLEEYFLVWIHQIKTPITAAYLILNQAPGPNFHQALRQELIKIENYANMALNYLKITNPSNDLEITRVDLRPMIIDLVKRYRIYFIQKDISLDLDLPKEGLPLSKIEVTTDANLTAFMIEQILSNALKYTPAGTITISYDSNGQVLTIQDTGIGIQAEDLPKVFNKGYSGLNGQLNKKSSGIGLYLVDLIAHRLGQPVSLSSQLGQGTQVQIQFKLTNV